jgi:hypothetical protein
MSLRVGPPASPCPGHVPQLMHPVHDIPPPSPVCSLLQYSVLTGDYLLSKAIVSLARLQNVRVVSLMSMAVADFIEGKSRFLNANARHGPAAVCHGQTKLVKLMPGPACIVCACMLTTRRACAPRRTGRFPIPRR